MKVRAINVIKTEKSYEDYAAERDNLVHLCQNSQNDSLQLGIAKGSLIKIQYEKLKYKGDIH